MTNGEFFLERWEMEQNAFRKVLAALPPDKLDYRPHERSTSAGGLAWQLATEQGDLVDLLETDLTRLVDHAPDEEDGEGAEGTPDEEDLRAKGCGARSAADHEGRAVGDSKVEKPVGRGRHRHGFRTDLERVDLGGDDPGDRTPRGGEEKDIDGTEND